MCNSIINSKLLKKFASKIKNNKIDINSIIKKELNLNKRKKITDLISLLYKTNLVFPSINATFFWLNMIEKKRNISFSLMQGQRNFFGSHKIKFYKK